MLRFSTFFKQSIFLACLCSAALAQDAGPRSTIAIVGDADRLTIGQDGYCGNRTEIDSPSGKQFRVPSNKPTHFYIRSKVHAQVAIYTCEGDFSFMPAPGLLHVIRYIINDDRCLLEMFQSEPGEKPRPMPVNSEERRSCLLK
jgi:hypothetical protein